MSVRSLVRDSGTGLIISGSLRPIVNNGVAMRNNYIKPDNWVCPVCGEQAEIVPLDESFDYSGTHCTFGRSGTYTPPGNGRPVCSANECSVEDVDIDVYEPEEDRHGGYRNDREY